MLKIVSEKFVEREVVEEIISKLQIPIEWAKAQEGNIVYEVKMASVGDFFKVRFVEI